MKIVLRAIERILRISSARQASSFVHAALVMCYAVTLSGAKASGAADDAIWSIDVSVEEIVGDVVGAERVLTLAIEQTPELIRP